MSNELEMIANLKNQTLFFFLNQWHCIVSDDKIYLPFSLVFCIWLDWKSQTFIAHLTIKSN